MKISLAQEVHQEEVARLRAQEYAKAKGFSVDLTTLRWQQTDSECYVLIAEDGKIVSTMRGEVIAEQSLLEAKLECPWTFHELKFPVLLLSRAATDSAYRGAGLNLVLRYWFLLLAQHHNIPFVVGTFVEGSPRENSLREMGYQFFSNDLGWQKSTYRSHRPVSVVSLDMAKHGARALAYCAEKCTEAMNFEFPPLRFIRS